MCLATMAYIMQHAQYVLLFLVLVVNSDRFWILQSYTLLLKFTSHLFLCAFAYNVL